MIPNPHAQWRLEFAHEISQKLSGYPGIRAIIAGGSVARGYADEYSDLELPLYWNELPGDALRLAIAADLGADFLYPYNGPANEDNLLIHGFQVDLWHNTVQQEEQVFEKVLREHDMDAGDSNFMDTVRFCIPLYGEDIIATWKEKAAIYPEALARLQVEQALNGLQATHLAILAQRGNPTLFYGQVSQIQQQVFLMLLALNRRYFPTYKWMYPTLAEMTVKPVNIESRLRRAFTCDPLEAAEDTMRVVEETLRLVQEQFPQLDVSPVRSQLKMTRVAHRDPVRFAG